VAPEAETWWTLDGIAGGAVDLFIVASASITAAATAVIGLGHCLWCALDESEER
jgi:hypothetical protein